MNSDEAFECYKAYIIGDSESQQVGVDYLNNFSHVVILKNYMDNLTPCSIEILAQSLNVYQEGFLIWISSRNIIHSPTYGIS